MFDHKHYVPILKTKLAEIWSLAHLRTDCRTNITPLLEVHRPKKQKDKPPPPMIAHIEKVFDSIRLRWGVAPFFVDTEWINDPHDAAAAITETLNACRRREMKAIPVVKIGYDDVALDAIKSAVEIDGRGYMFRVDAEDAGAHVVIGRILSYLGVSKGEVHLLLDYKEQPMNLAVDILRLPSIDEWATLSAASAAFPKTISNLPQRTWIDMPRFDWNSWERSTREDSLARKPTFSDYATRCAGPPANGGDPIVHL